MTKRTIWASIVLVSALAVGLSAGAEAKKVKKPAKQQDEQPAGPEKKFPTKASFDLKSINGKPVSGDLLASLMIDDSYRGSGAAGCNNWSATIYPASGQRLAVGPIALTRKECGKEAMQLEHLFTAFLHASPAWDLEGATLTLKLQNNVMILQRSL